MTPRPWTILRLGSAMMNSMSTPVQSTIPLPEVESAGPLPAIWSRRTLRAFLRELAGFLQLPPRLKVWEFAARHVFLSAEVTAEPGFYNPDRIPYQKRVQEWATDPRINDIVLCTAAQLIK